MNEIILLSSEFENKFLILENYFNSLTNYQKNYIIKDNEIIATSSLPPPPSSSSSTIESTITSTLDLPLPPSSSSSRILNERTEGNEVKEGREEKEGKEGKEKEENEDLKAVLYFHELANNVIEVLIRLQALVKAIQTHLPTTSGLLLLLLLHLLSLTILSFR